MYQELRSISIQKKKKPQLFSSWSVVFWKPGQTQGWLVKHNASWNDLLTWNTNLGLANIEAGMNLGVENIHHSDCWFKQWLWTKFLVACLSCNTEKKWFTEWIIALCIHNGIKSIFELTYLQKKKAKLIRTVSNFAVFLYFWNIPQSWARITVCSLVCSSLCSSACWFPLGS